MWGQRHCILLSLFLLSFCTQLAFADAPTVSRKDPYENFNRHSFALNQKVDEVVYTPLATIYKTALPTVAQHRMSDFFNNLGDVTVFANDVLQAKVYQGTQDIWRIFFNSTFGVLGFFDVASKIGLPAHQNDFGMTLTHWGYKGTNYFVIPFLGPSTVRDTYGLAIDYEVLSVYPYIHNQHWRYSLLGLNLVQQRAQLLQMQKLIDEAGVDPYAFQRDAYLQRRDYLMAKNFNDTINDPTLDSGKDPYVAE